MGKLNFPTEIINNLVKDSAPSLSPLDTPESWLLFDRLNLRDSDMEWLRCDVRDWDSFPGFKAFQSFVAPLTVVNDPAERGVNCQAKRRLRW